MRMWRTWPGLLVLFLCAPASAHAQDAGKAGVTMGFPTAIGFIWHATDRLAVRPEFTFAFGSSELGTIEGGSTDTTSVGAGASVLFYLKTFDNLRTYVSPRFTYDHTNISTDISTAVTSFARETTTSGYSAAGSFGAQYSMGSRFATFGELGLVYAHHTLSSPLTPLEPTSKTFGVRTAVGVILYF